MKITEHYNDIANFWEILGPFFISNLVLFIVSYYINKDISFIDKLGEFIQSTIFTKIKNVLTAFELWEKLPIAIALFCLAYLTIFKSFTDATSSFTYSDYDLFTEYSDKSDFSYVVMTIDSTVIDSTISSKEIVSQLQYLVQHFKTTSELNYSQWVGWADNQVKVRLSIYIQTIIITFLLLITYYMRIKLVEGVNKLIKIRMAVVTTLFLILIPILRIYVEQAIESRFVAQLDFVSNEIANGNIVKKNRTNEESKKILTGNTNDNMNDFNTIWLSRYFEHCTLFPDRNIKD